MKQRKQLLIFLLIGCLFVAISVIPDLVSDELKTWCSQQLGPSYPWYLIGFFVVASFVVLWFTSDFKNIFSGKTTAKSDILNIPWSLEAKRRLLAAKEALANANPEAALILLYQFNYSALAEQLTPLSSRLAKYRQDRNAGIQTGEERDTGFNRIIKDLLSLISTLEASFAENEAQNRKIRDAFRQKYRNRLDQKLASRQPVRLRPLASKEGTSELVVSAFHSYNDENIPQEIGRLFQDAHGRLLLVGQPGAGKTTLLLQLADRLFDLEADALPIVINLASWRSSFIKLENWLEEVLASQMSTNKSGAKAILRQANLILLLDGLDELKEAEAMQTALVAIAAYGATAGRQFVLTCRMEEYKAVQADARVNLQIEVGPLNAEQIIEELEKTGFEQPEAKILAQALRKDALLQEAVEAPFYFNTLQLLYAGSLPKFSSSSLEERKAEIERLFVADALRMDSNAAFSSEKSGHWLAFLAKRMSEKGKVVFELLDLQSDLQSGTKSEKIMEGLLGGLVFGVLAGLTFGLFGGLVGGLVLGVFLLGIAVSLALEIMG